MMKAKVEFEKRGLRKLEHSLKDISRYAGKGSEDLLDQATLFFAKAVIKRTPPGSAGKPKQIAKKYRYRPIEKMPSGKNVYAYYSEKQRKTHYFETRTPIPKRARDKRGMRRIKHRIKYWHKRRNRWAYWYYDKEGQKFGTFDSKMEKRRKISYAGAAKAGWLAIYRGMGKPAERYDSRRKLGTYRRFTSNRGARRVVTVKNLVEYAPKIAPYSVGLALKATESRLRHTYARRIEKRIGRKWG